MSTEECSIQLVNKLGLHTRAASKFVDCALRYQSDIQVTYHNRTVDGKSIMKVMTLGASFHTKLFLRISGKDAKDAMLALTELIENRFGEAE